MIIIKETPEENRMKSTVSVLFAIFFLCTICHANTLLIGTVELENVTDFSGTTVRLLHSETVPAVNVFGLLALMAGISYALFSRKRSVKTAVLISCAIIFFISLIRADLIAETITSTDGSFAFEEVPFGIYKVEMEHSCYITHVIDPLNVSGASMEVPTVLLPHASAVNESRTFTNLRLLRGAEYHYQLNSNPHTYTGDLACLVSGNGTSGSGYLPPDFADGTVDGYQYLLVSSLPQGGVIYSWSATAFPIVYNCTGRTSFYTDIWPDCGACTARGTDIGGGPGNSGLPLICDDDEHQTAYGSLMTLAAAQTDYNNNSSPHTYTGLLECLASGNGAGGVQFICTDLGTGRVCNYQYLMGLCAEPDTNGSYWCWSATAYPVTYGEYSTLSFYIDETAWIRGADTGGSPGDTDLPHILLDPFTCD